MSSSNSLVNTHLYVKHLGNCRYLTENAIPVFEHIVFQIKIQVIIQCQQIN